MLLEHLGRGELDLALAWGEGERAGPSVEEIADLPVVWIDRAGDRWEPDGVVPLVLFERPCLFRSRGLAALDVARLPWRIAFTSPSLSGLWAAVSAGLGITVRTPQGLPGRVAVLNAGGAGLPPLGDVSLRLRTSEGAVASPAAVRLRTILRESLLARLRPGFIGGATSPDSSVHPLDAAPAA